MLWLFAGYFLVATIYIGFDASDAGTYSFLALTGISRAYQL